jgi:hypothetical protein
MVYVEKVDGKWGTEQSQGGVPNGTEDGGWWWYGVAQRVPMAQKGGKWWAV